VNALSVIAPLLALASGSVPGDGSSSCPSVSAVREALESMLAPRSPRPAWIRISDADARLTIEFVLADSWRIERRAIAAAPDCAERARAAAIVMASWLGDLPAASLAAPEIVSRRPDATLVSARPAPASVEPRRTWLGAGIGGAASGGLGANVRVEVQRLGVGGGLGWALAAGVARPRGISVGGGSAEWMRPNLDVSGVYEWSVRGGGIDVAAGALAGLTVAWGDDYAANDRSASLLWGLTGGARAFATRGRLRFWLDLRGSRWLQTQRVWRDVRPDGMSVSATLPAAEIAVTAGASVSWN
jgi:hypothetical protein